MHRMILSFGTLLLPLAILSLSGNGMAQGRFSIAANIGYASSTDKADNYSLSAAAWPAAAPSGNNGNSNNSQSNSLVFLSGASGLSKSFTLSYDVSSHVAFSVLYRSIDFNSSENHRKATCTGLGIQMRINLAKNSKPLVPFFEVQYLFSNSNSLTMDAANSSNNNLLVQPAYKKTFTGSLGVGIDAGIEFKLSENFGLSIQGGFHGIELTSGSPSVSGYPATISPPSGVDGVWFIQGCTGLHYYFVGKKRDF